MSLKRRNVKGNLYKRDPRCHLIIPSKFLTLIGEEDTDTIVFLSYLREYWSTVHQEDSSSTSGISMYINRYESYVKQKLSYLLQRGIIRTYELSDGQTNLTWSDDFATRIGDSLFT